MLWLDQTKKLICISSFVRTKKQVAEGDFPLTRIITVIASQQKIVLFVFGLYISQAAHFKSDSYTKNKLSER